MKQRFPEITEEAYSSLSAVLEESFGLSLRTISRESLSRKLHIRLQKLHFQNFDDYAAFLVISPNAAEEISELPSYLMNTESYFFREQEQLPVFIDFFRDMLTNKKRQVPIRILSAGCATGQEPYGLAIMLSKHFDHLGPERVEIVGLDILGQSIDKAKIGVFNSYALRNVDALTIDRYFEIIDRNIYKLDKHVMKLCHFTQGNIVDPAVFERLGTFDIIFCRNVLIYMSVRAVSRIAHNFFKALSSTGYLFLGQSESFWTQTHLFEPVKLPDVTVYRKKLSGK